MTVTKYSSIFGHPGLFTFPKVAEHLILKRTKKGEHLLNLAPQLSIVSQSGVSWPCNCGIWFSGAVFTLTVSHHRHHWRVVRGVGSTGSAGIRRHFYDSSGKVSSFAHKIVQGSSVKPPWVLPPDSPQTRLVFSPCSLLPWTGWGEHRGGSVSPSLSLLPVISEPFWKSVGGHIPTADPDRPPLTSRVLVLVSSGYQVSEAIIVMDERNFGTWRFGFCHVCLFAFLSHLWMALFACLIICG